MCTISMVGDHFTKKWEPYVTPPQPNIFYPLPEVSRLEFDQLKKEVEECKRLLKAAKQIDEALGTPDCEMDEKLEIVRKVAELVGVDLEDVLG